MISDEDVKQLFWNGNELLLKYLDPDKMLMTQFYRGVSPDDWKDQPRGNCFRHMTIFKNYNAIPKFCFDCYKVVITPRTVVELFKLMVVFERFKLPDDNTRKCMIECREKVAGTYKGLIYCLGIENGRWLLETVRNAVSEEISDKIPVILKRGCSEYAAAYPEYANSEEDTATIKYKQEWKEYEDIVDKDFVVKARVKTFNQTSYTLKDAEAMLAWLRYAATIGDPSYLTITGQPLDPWHNLKRPTPFQPVEDE